MITVIMACCGAVCVHLTWLFLKLLYKFYSGFCVTSKDVSTGYNVDIICGLPLGGPDLNLKNCKYLCKKLLTFYTVQGWHRDCRYKAAQITI